MSDQDTELISANALNVTKVVGFGAAAAGVVSAVVAALGAVRDWDVMIQVALIGLAAVALVVTAAVVITDIRTRARLAMWVVPKKGDEAAVPVLLEIWNDAKKAGAPIEKLAGSAIASASGDRGEDGAPLSGVTDEDLREMILSSLVKVVRHEAVGTLFNGLNRR